VDHGKEVDAEKELDSCVGVPNNLVRNGNVFVRKLS